MTRSNWNNDIKLDTAYRLIICEKIITGEKFTWRERLFFWFHRLRKKVR